MTLTETLLAHVFLAALQNDGLVVVRVQTGHAGGAEEEHFLACESA